MSVKMIDYIVDEHNIEIDSTTLKRVKVNYAIRVLLISSQSNVISGAMFSQLLKFNH